MQDKKMKGLGLFTAVSLAVCLVASCIVSNAGSSYAATNSLKWTRITIPVVDDNQLYPGSDVGPMAVTPDGETVFAAVRDEVTGTWDLLESIDSAFSWQDTGLSDAMAAQSPADISDIVAIELSPSWNDDDTIFVATKNRVYYSEDRGSTFDALVHVPKTVYDIDAVPPVVPPYYVISSLALGLDSSGRVVVAVGTHDSALVVPFHGEVYILDTGVWSAPYPIGAAVLAVGLSPSYADDQAVIAVVTDGIQTKVRTKRLAGGWGLTIPDAIFKDQDSNDFWSNKACIGLPDDYNATSLAHSVRTCFVGLWGVGPLWPAWDPLGDVFRINGGWMSASTVTDLNVRGNVSASDPSETDIWSMAVSGSTSNMTIIAGTVRLSLGISPQFLVYTSSDSGVSWYPQDDDYISYKQPTGEELATVVMTSSVAYAGTFGDQSAVSVASSAQGQGGVPFYSWNQRGLIDTSIDEISDMSPSTAYQADGKMFITTRDATPPGDTSLWRTVNEGRDWERVYCSTLTADSTLSPTCMFNTVKTVSGGAVVLAQIGGSGVIPSTDDGATFRFDFLNPYIGNVPGSITAFAVKDASTYYAAVAGGVVAGWTDDSGAWTPAPLSEIPSTDTVVDIVLTGGGDIYAGTNNGGVYKDSGGDLVFAPVDPKNGQPGLTGDIVHVASNPCDDNFIYAGIQGTQGIWRFDLGDDAAEWEQIADGAEVGNISSIVCSDCIGMDGVLYAVSISKGTGWRSVNPTATKEAPMFEELKSGLGTGDSVKRGLKIVSGDSSNLLFAVGGASYTQLWTASDEIVKMKLLAPKDGTEAYGDIMEDKASLGRARVMLQWKQIPGAESYEVQIGFDSELDSPVSDMSYYTDGTPYTEGNVTVVYPWLGTKYYWRVRMGKAGPSGTVGAPYSSQWSDIWSFTTPLGPALAMPELLGPKAGQTNVIINPLLQWNSSVDATSYELILAANCDWDHPVHNLSGESAIRAPTTAYQVPSNLAKNTSYCWKVRGINAITRSPWSDTGTFTTGFTAGTESVGLPVWVWVIIVLATVFILSVLVLITQSRRY